MKWIEKAAALLLAALLLTACTAEAVEPAPVPSDRPRLIAHAGGAIWGYRYTNSLEALDSAYENGFRYIELDFELTTDGEIALIHDWEPMARRMLFSEGQRSREEFLNSPSFMGLTLMDAERLKAWMDEHSDAYIITDIKHSDNAAVLKLLRASLGGAAERLIPQIYRYEEYETVNKLGFDNIILTLYKLDIEPEKLADFAKKHKLWAITVAYDRLTDELMEAITSSGSGTAIYAHTVNALDIYEEWRPKGLCGIYTDYFVPAHWAE